MSDKKKETQGAAENQKLSTKENILQTVKFALFSASAGIIQIATYTLFYEACHFKEWIAYLISLVLSVLWNFTFNRKFTFKSANNVPIAMLITVCSLRSRLGLRSMPLPILCGTTILLRLSAW